MKAEFSYSPNQKCVSFVLNDLTVWRVIIKIQYNPTVLNIKPLLIHLHP